MSVRAITIESAQMNEALARLRSSGDLAAAVEYLELAWKGRLPVDPLMTTLNEVSDGLQLQLSSTASAIGGIQAVSASAAPIAVRYRLALAAAAATSRRDADEADEATIWARDLVDQMSSLAKEQSKRRTALVEALKRAPYGEFLPAYELPDLFHEQISAEFDPGAVIGTYIAALGCAVDANPSGTERDRSSPIRPKQAAVALGACWFLTRSVSNYLQAEEKATADPGADGRIGVDETLVARLHAMRLVLDAIFESLSPSVTKLPSDAEATSTISDLQMLVALSILSTGHLIGWLRCLSAKRLTSVLPHVLRIVPLGERYVDDAEVELVAGDIASYWSSLDTSLDQESIADTIKHMPPLSWEDVGDLISDVFISVQDADTRCRQAMAESLTWVQRKFTHYRRKRGGVAPLDLQDTNHLFNQFNEVALLQEPVDYPDLWISISRVVDFEKMAEPLGLRWIDGSLSDDATPLRARASAYLDLVEQSETEGFLELAGSLLGFFFLSQASQGTDRLHVDWSAASPLTSRLLASSNGRTLRQSIELALRFFDEASASIDRLVLSSLLGGSVHAFASGPRLASIKAKDGHMGACEEIVARWAPDIWSRYEVDMLSKLAEAEYQFRRGYDSRTGEGLSDYGSQLTAYAKPFEEELKTRIDPLLNDESTLSELVAARILKKKERVTIGVAMRILEYGAIPEPLRRRISAAVGELPLPRDLRADLKTLATLRNRGAHPGRVTEHDLNRLRCLLDESGLVRRLGEWLRPAVDRGRAN